MRADCKRPLRSVATYRRLISLRVVIILGTAILAKTMVTAMTIINSSSEKPCVFFCVFESSIVRNALLYGFAGMSPASCHRRGGLGKGSKHDSSVAAHWAFVITLVTNVTC